ncbi:hypothetical protein D505_03222 [Elizabethkingia anophelis R26]|nr:hypothetical protein D505_03222 [Elizabethkingia anophelis R26]EQB90901.1 hypothetical protein C874_14415 [Elizabethkingia anophelis 502]
MGSVSAYLTLNLQVVLIILSLYLYLQIYFLISKSQIFFFTNFNFHICHPVIFKTQKLLSFYGAEHYFDLGQLPQLYEG